MVGRVVVACVLGGCAIAPASALAAGPAWHPPTYPSAPKAGLPSPSGFPIGLGVGPNGRASVLYGARGGNLYSFSRTSARGAWSSGRRWRANAGTTPSGELDVAVGSKVTALWTDRKGDSNGQGNLYSSTGTQRGGSGRALISPAAGAPWVGTARGGVAYAYGRANAGGPGVFGGASPARTRLASASPIASFASEMPPGVQSAVDGRGNQTAVWPENGTLMVSSRGAGAPPGGSR